ncbi:hypothetical protein CcI49_06795 [Frankia sp. CcI49]|uniref:hypothetical protein n=1 Tax=Frankia sp. CcI49 TaxID=1745382 RepID=UPI0009D40B39|nr:hypothetical protein [Frankia sp. CcI49]ONH61291.1 hypothetical protein CcI49_06795 [Frankia sp. CcI49]
MTEVCPDQPPDDEPPRGVTVLARDGVITVTVDRGIEAGELGLNLAFLVPSHARLDSVDTLPTGDGAGGEQPILRFVSRPS